MQKNREEKEKKHLKRLYDKKWLNLALKSIKQKQIIKKENNITKKKWKDLVLWL